MARGWRDVLVFVVCVALASVAFGVTPAHAVVDVWTPDLATMSVSPSSSVDISAADQTVTFKLRATDVGTGVSSVCVFIDFEGDPYSDVCMSAANRISGDAFDGTYEKSLVFPRYSHTGAHP